MPEEFQHLKNAPITEALLDVRVEPPPGTTIETLTAAFRSHVDDAFPEQKPILKVQAQLSFGGESKGFGASETVGNIFWSASRKRAVQARLDGFSVNHVGGYEDWDALKRDAQQYWKHFLVAGQPLRVIRCAVRFINRLELPVGDDLSKHLRTRPEAGEKLPQVLDEYFMRLILPFAAQRRAVITQATIPLEDGGASGKRSLILDIDAFSETSLAPDSDEIWAEFEELRIVKNRCFFDSLQTETWRAYQ